MYWFNVARSASGGNTSMICLQNLVQCRENNMPDSPETKPAQTSPTVAAMPRPASTSSSVMNGSIHSPHGSVNGRTPSPHDGQSQQALPPACGARQLSKLKRFLTTLQQFGSDISPEIGERVRSLVLGLVNSTISIEDFHSKLQEATNFPLRPFVIPFLKANLPLLQRELLHCARMAKQTPAQYLSQNEHVLLATRGSPQHESGDLISPELNENGKRKASPERTKENGVTVNNYNNEHMHPAKRLHPISPSLPRVSPGGVPQHLSGPLRLEDISLSREQRERENRLYPDRELRVEDDWRQVDSMLNCIIDMVERTKRTLAVLQHRAIQDREELTLWARRRAEGAEIDVKKRAEEAINEVKRQAVAELQKAVQAAEQNANDVIGKERAKMEHAIEQARREAAEDALAAINHQEDTSENCWNCGRKASETCSGCNTARYCGPFCQHKDWENHHKVCGQHLEAATSTATSTATTCPATTSPADSVTSSRSSASRSATPVAENRSSNGSETSR